MDEKDFSIEHLPGLRLELLKLTYTHARDTAQIVHRTEQLEAYVLQGQTQKQRSSRKRQSTTDTL